MKRIITVLIMTAVLFGGGAAALKADAASFDSGSKPNLKAYSQYNNKVRLKWSEVSGASGYYIYSSGKHIKTVKGKTSCQVTKLKRNTTYSFSVRAYLSKDGRKALGAMSEKRSAKTKYRTPRLLIIADNRDIRTKGWIWQKLRAAGFKTTVIHYSDIYRQTVDKDTFSISKYDALFLPGGGCVTPSVYGAKRSKATYRTNRRFDEVEIALVKKFAKKKKPVLGWCRGCQIINVAFGGTLYQNIGSKHDNGHHRTMKLSKKSFMRSLYGSSYSFTHFHIQAVKKLGDGLVATQWDKHDGHIEGIEHKSLPIYGIQYWGLKPSVNKRFYNIVKNNMSK